LPADFGGPLAQNKATAHASSRAGITAKRQNNYLEKRQANQ
jgi:hypothetical protein